MKIRGKHYRVCGWLDKSHLYRDKPTKWWQKFALATVPERIKMLQARADIKSRDKNIYYFKRRTKKHKHNGLCQVCGKPSYCKHHISPLICGGTNQSINLVDICYYCHHEIHTWMIPKTPEYIKDMDEAFRNSIG